MTSDLASKAAEAFTYYDVNCDGKLTFKELVTALRALGKLFTDDELKEVLNEMKKTESDQFVQQELGSILNKLNRDISSSAESVIEAFKIFDKTGSGVVNSFDIRHALTTVGNKLNDEEISEMLSEADPNNDGRIQYEQFVKRMTSQYKL